MGPRIWNLKMKVTACIIVCVFCDEDNAQNKFFSKKVFQINGTNKIISQHLTPSDLSRSRFSVLRVDEFIKFDEFDEKLPVHT